MLTIFRVPFVTLAFVVVVSSGVDCFGQSIFPDKNLEAVVRKYVFEKRNNDEPLTEKDVENISTIQGKNKEIKDLSGLEKCYSLALLDLEGNEISDVSALKELTNLQSVNLAGSVGPLCQTPAHSSTHGTTGNDKPGVW